MFNQFFLFVLIYFFSFGFINSQSNNDFLVKAKNNFLTDTKLALEKKDFSNVRIQLVTISPGITVATAFGHSAVRVIFEKEFGDKDYYVDFGQYDESLIFLWSFLRGNARFYFAVVPASSAYEAWDSSGRGFQTSEFKMTSEQKEKMLKEILHLFENQSGYEYNNFKSNCVTFIRDLINHTYDIKLELTTSANQNTWRKRVKLYSDQIIWLHIEETLLFDRDPDKERKATELVFLPIDLKISVEDAKIVNETKTLIPDRWKKNLNSNISGLITFVIFIFMVVSQIPKGLLLLFERNGKIIFSLFSGLGGSFALLVLLVTNFDFMDENIVVLVFTPIDFLLLKKNFIEHKFFKHYILLRLFMILAAFILRFTFFKQDIDYILFFTSLFFLINAYSVFFKKSELTNA